MLEYAIDCTPCKGDGVVVTLIFSRFCNIAGFLAYQVMSSTSFVMRKLFFVAGPIFVFM